jgi:hypothetical protein
MFRVPVYVAAGSCGNAPPLRSMLKAMLSVRFAFLFAPVILTVASRKPAFAAPKATVLTSGAANAPLSEMLKAEDGMLFPAPSVRAAAALAKYASIVTFVRPGLRTHAVVAVTLVLPGLLALPAASVKFTAFADRETVSDSDNCAFNAIGCAPELSCAEAKEADITTMASIVRIDSLFALLLKFFLPLDVCRVLLKFTCCDREEYGIGEPKQ